IGSGKLMHSILTDLCTGCELCIPPCPVDCIDLIEDHHAVPDESMRIAEQDDLRNRYYAHIQREEKRRLNRKGPVVRANIDTTLFARFSAQNDSVPDIVITQNEVKPTIHFDAKSTIELAKIRTQIKKLEKQLSVREDTQKRLQLDELNHQLNALQGA
ncbi:4Fe-4S binding protein, partial [Acinetobacter sp.]|uniref:4Fe-4S binding protein n=1 Tax=Acinetobacter sp. TaxID=472 RepID=UPI003C73C148